MKKGSLIAIVGCMSCGKSVELIRRLVRARIASQRVVAFRPSHDTRTKSGCIASRTGNSFPAISVKRADSIAMEVLAPSMGVSVDVVGIDEVQFFDERLLPVIYQLIDEGIQVIVAGLDTVYNGEPFGIVPSILAVADEVHKLNAICVRCGAIATRTQLKIPVPANPPVDFFVGGDEKYEARCRDCHIPVPTKPV